MGEEQFVTITLPSKGLAYEDPSTGTIQVRPFKGRDEALLAELTLDNAKKKFVTIIKNVIKGIDPEKLTSGDVQYILLWQAINSYNRDYPIQLVCEHCLKNIQVVCDLSKINSVELSDDFVQPIVVKLSNRTVQLRLLTLNDEISEFDWSVQGKSTYFYLYALSIVDEKMDLLAKLSMLEDMSPSDLNVIRETLKKYDHGPDMITPYICPLCEYEGKIELPFRYEKLFSFSKQP